ncbi:MAG: hypothetical protein ACYCY1_16960, partial [Sulfuriferula sp.]
MAATLVMIGLVEVDIRQAAPDLVGTICKGRMLGNPAKQGSADIHGCEHVFFFLRSLGDVV